MARTVWGAHKRYMDTYLNVYKGYYVSRLSISWLAVLMYLNSSLATVPVGITKDTTGFVVVSTMSSTCQDTDFQQLRLRQRFSSIVSQCNPMARQLADIKQTKSLRLPLWVSTTSFRVKQLMLLSL